MQYIFFCMVQNMSTRSKLAEDIEYFLGHHDLRPSELGWFAVRNSRLVNKLLNGGDCTTRTMDKLYDFMDEYSNKYKKEKTNDPTNEGR